MRQRMGQASQVTAVEDGASSEKIASSGQTFRHAPHSEHASPITATFFERLIAP
jgi:hypothetical protein